MIAGAILLARIHKEAALHSTVYSPPAQRTAVKLPPHPESTSCLDAMTEPVVFHHGRQGGRCSSRRGAAVSFNSLLGGVRYGAVMRSSDTLLEAPWLPGVARRSWTSSRLSRTSIVALS